MDNLDNIKVKVIEKNAVAIISSQQMIGFPTLVGPAGPVGPQGPAGPSGQGAWGTITGDIADQTDLQDELDLKANIADLGSMAEVNDAPSDGLEYVRKNGDWAVSSGGGGGGDATWGSITGTLSNQTDLQSALNAKQNTLTFDTTPTAASTNPVTSGGIKTALDAKANSADLGTMAEVDDVSSSNNVAYGRRNAAWYDLDGRYYTESEMDTALSAKANNSILADAFSPSTTYAIGDYCIADGALYRFTSAHTGNWTWADVTQVVAMNELAALSARLESRMDFKITGTVSASNYTLTDSRINSEHWEVDWIYFATSSNVTSQIHWTTDITNHQVSLSATYAGSTNVVVNMHWVQ